MYSATSGATVMLPKVPERGLKEQKGHGLRTLKRDCHPLPSPSLNARRRAQIGNSAVPLPHRVVADLVNTIAANLCVVTVIATKGCRDRHRHEGCRPRKTVLSHLS